MRRLEKAPHDFHGGAERVESNFTIVSPLGMSFAAEGLSGSRSKVTIDAKLIIEAVAFSGRSTMILPAGPETARRLQKSWL